MSLSTSRNVDQRPPRRALIALCATQITSWGVIYYALPVALTAITTDTGWTSTQVTAAYSVGLLASAAAGIPVGRLLDRHGPRTVMTAGSLLAVPAMIGIATAPNLPVFFAVWIVAGMASAAVFYQAAFAAITAWYGTRRVRALTTVTLAGGLASTVFAPITDLLLQHLTWRATYLVLAGILALITIPAHALLLPHHRGPLPGPAPHPGAVSRTAPMGHVLRSPQFLVLTASFTVNAFAVYAAGLTLIPLLTGRGFTPTGAAVSFGLLGAGQLLGRIGYAQFTARTTAVQRTAIILAATAVPIVLLAVLRGPMPVLVALGMMLGAARGADTLLQATLIADVWGTTRYGTIAGYFSAPITAAAAIAPWAATALADVFGSYPVTWLLLAALAGLPALTAALTIHRFTTSTGPSHVTDPA